MFDLGWTELLVVGIVALIVVGPKDLPKMFRTLGQFMAKARAMAREFQRAMDDAADATGVKDVARDLKQATNPQGMGLDELNKLKNWDPLRDDEHSDKGKGKDNKAPDADDEAELDRVAAEMENLRRERAQAKASAAKSSGIKPGATSDATKPGPTPTEPVSKAPAESPTQTTPDVSDKNNA